MKEDNIKNMTSLWRNYGATLEQPIEAQIYTSDYWPNKLWVNAYNKSCGQDSLRKSIIRLLTKYPDHVLASWSNQFDDLVTSWTTENDSKIKYINSLIGMSLDCTNLMIHNNVESTTMVTAHLIDKQQAEFWCNLCSKGFGYNLDTRAILSAIAYSNNRLYWYSVDDRPVGTALTSMNKKIMGLHQISVLPEWRGKGIASAIVNHLLKSAKLAGAHRVILQASPMGLGLYKKLGFTEDFELKSYKLVV